MKLGQRVSEWVHPSRSASDNGGRFLLHINNLRTLVNTVKYVDDSGTVYEESAADAHDSQVQVATVQACDWSIKNLTKVNSEKAEEMIILFSKKCKDVVGVIIERKCHQRDRADVTEFVTLVRLSSLGQHVGVLALAGYKRRKSALTAGPINSQVAWSVGFGQPGLGSSH